MTALAPHIAAFLHERLPVQQGASEHTRDSYSYAFQLLFTFAGEKLKMSPSSLQLEHLDAPLVLSFLENLESSRGNKAASRNVRLAAIKSFMRFVEHRVPSSIEQVRRILAIPAKKADLPLVGYLSVDEMKAVLDIPDPTTKMGIRDRAMLLLGFTAGLRVSELVGLRLESVSLQSPASIFVRGKGRRERNLPLCRESAQALRAWLAIRGQPSVPELFLNARDKQMTRSGFEYICAMVTLKATRDIRKVALWLGHSSIQSTEIYTRADPSEKLEAIEALTPPVLRRGRFRPPDKLLELLRP